MAPPRFDGAGLFVTQFDWEYHLLLALSLALVVIGMIGVLFLAT